MQGQRAEVDWTEGGVPVSRRFDDPYFSLQGGAAETAHVFLAGNGLPGRFRDGVHIAELGFGTGLNFLVTLAAWRGAGIAGRLCFTSFEAFPMAQEDRARALAVFAGLPEERLTVPGVTEGADYVLTVIEGDARVTLPAWEGRADAWFLDGFSPAKNPELWEPALLVEVGRHSAPGATAATYSAAGHVRQALSAAGFAVERRPGYGTKRHMTVARRDAGDA